jgi:hypothetical protein
MEGFGVPADEVDEDASSGTTGVVAVNALENGFTA